MDTFDQPITIYSRWKKGRDEAWIRTVVLNASWYGGQAVTVSDSGLNTADKYTVRVLANRMEDYVTPDEWRALEAPPDGMWTARAGDLIVKGVVDDEITADVQITGKHTNCFVVTAAFDNRRGALQHLKIEGK